MCVRATQEREREGESHLDYEGYEKCADCSA